MAWDQRGHRRLLLGRKRETLNKDQAIQDAPSWWNICAASWPKKNLHLGRQLGHRVGHLPVLSPPAAHRGYVGSGQLVNGALNEEISYDFAMAEAQKAGDEDGAHFKANRSPGKRLLPAGVQGYDGPAPHHEKNTAATPRKRAPTGPDTALPLLRSKEFSLTDKIGLARTHKKCLTYMWPSTIQCDFTTECTRFEMPFYIFQGRHDNNTPAPWCRAISIPSRRRTRILSGSSIRPTAPWPRSRKNTKSCCAKSCCNGRKGGGDRCMKKELSNGRMFGLCLGEFARAVLGGLIVTYTLKFFNVTPLPACRCCCPPA